MTNPLPLTEELPRWIKSIDQEEARHDETRRLNHRNSQYRIYKDIGETIKVGFTLDLRLSDFELLYKINSEDEMPEQVGKATYTLLIGGINYTIRNERLYDGGISFPRNDEMHLVSFCYRHHSADNIGFSQIMSEAMALHQARPSYTKFSTWTSEGLIVSTNCQPRQLARLMVSTIKEVKALYDDRDTLFEELAKHKQSVADKLVARQREADMRPYTLLAAAAAAPDGKSQAQKDLETERWAKELTLAQVMGISREDVHTFVHLVSELLIANTEFNLSAYPPMEEPDLMYSDDEE